MRIGSAAAWRLGTLLLSLALASAARGQTDPRMALDPWPTDKTWGQTLDTLVFQGQGHVKGEFNPDGTDRYSQLFWWDSIGRFRLTATADPNAPLLAYRYVTMGLASNSPNLPNHLDEVSMAAGLHLGQVSGGDVTAIFGAGYSGNNPFADSNGVFALAHLLWDKPLSDTDSLVLSLDYNGVSAFLPDIPLPGFEYIHRAEKLSYTVGFPRSGVSWELVPNLTLDAYYAVPYTADVSLDYKLSHSWSVFGGYHNFFEAFRLDKQDLTDRLLVQMSRVEVGIHYTNTDFVLKGAFFDASLAVGYAFAQEYSSGFDVRDMEPLAEASEVPYVALMLRGRF
jgi:hypothetical protein